jgi:hypothetical protein
MLEGGGYGLVEDITAGPEQLVEENRKAALNPASAEHRDRRVGVARSAWKLACFGDVPQTVPLQSPEGLFGVAWPWCGRELGDERP